MHDISIILYHFWKARRISKQLRTRDDLVRWQEKSLTRFFQKSLVKSPYYSSMRGKSLDEYPIMTKQLMLENFDQINTRNISLQNALSIARKAESNRDFRPMLGNITVGLSSGTSGKHSVFLASKNECLKWAGIMLAKALPQKLFHPKKIAFFLRANSNLYITLAKSKHIHFHFFDLTQDFKLNLQELSMFSPTILTAPASVLKFIAQAQEQGEININPLKIFSVAEVLEPEDKTYIEEVFDLRVHQIYQCTEGFLGISGQDGIIQLNEEYIHVEKEWIDKSSGRFVPIITDFTRTTQPIVRYRLDDVLVEDTESISPYTRLRAIEGRCDDICYFQSHQDHLVPIFADIVRQVISSVDIPMNEYRLTQMSPQELEIQTQPKISEANEKKIVQAIKQLSEGQNCKSPSVSFSSYQYLPLTHKRKRIERCFPLDSRWKEYQ